MMPNEEIFAAMRRVSKLSDDSRVFGLIRSLPMAVVEEQVSLYRRRNETAVALKARAKISLGPAPLLAMRMLVA